jgi:hypothetical protein
MQHFTGVKRFLKTLQPSNAILTVAGNVNVTGVKRAYRKMVWYHTMPVKKIQP